MENLEDYPLEVRWRSFRRMARNVARLIEIPEWKLNEASRASGIVVCRMCELPYHAHPNAETKEHFHLLCDGRVVKL